MKSAGLHRELEGRSEPIRVTILIPGFSDGGAQKQCIKLIHALQVRPDISLEVVTLHDGVHDALLGSASNQVLSLNVRSNYDPRNIIQIAHLLRRQTPDILFTWLHACDVYGFFLRGLLPGCRWLMAERDSSYPNDPRYLIRRMLGRHADAVLANSREGVRYWTAAGARGRLFQVSNIVDVPNRQTSARASLGRILHVGRLEPQKNPETTIRAFCLLAKRQPHLDFAIVGQGSLLSGLQEIVNREGLCERIRFLGFRHDAVQLIEEARLVVSLSHHEGSPNVLLEAVASGVPIVASNIPEHRALLGDDFPYLVNDVSSPLEAARVMEKSLADAAPQVAMRFAELQVLSMSSDTVADSYVSIFKEMVQV